MSLSIRARLTLWYSAVVIVVLASFTTAVSVTERRLELARIDGEIRRLSTMVEGVMRMEFRERLTLERAAADTSAEIVAPDHRIRLEREDGTVLVEWGLPLPALGPIRARDGPAGEPGTREDQAGPIRFFRRVVRAAGPSYAIVVATPLQAFAARQRQTASALWIGTFIALAVSALGGWLIARQTLAPLASMARQAAAASTTSEAIRLQTPHKHDEAGRLAASFNALLDRIRAAAGTQRQFMADASHELRTPVSVIKTAAEVALSRPHRTEAEYRDTLAIVSAQSERLTRLVDDMLFLSRSDADGLRIRHDAVYLDELVAAAVSSVKVVGLARHVSIDVRPQPSVTIVGDEGQLHRMLVNLLTNAVRHAAPGSAVTVESHVSQTQVSLRISNQGQPIPVNDQTRIFDRFVSLAPDADGAGLGLPIARRIADAHGGELTLLSSDAGWTTFEVRLPL